jgi:Cu(I)/Ag(I) efflux system membrane fusion protein
MSLSLSARPVSLRAVGFVLALLCVLPKAFAQPPLGQAAESTVYVCPMHPEIRRLEPGRCPICGMALVERAPAPEAEALPLIELSGRMIQALAVRTEPVSLRRLAPRVSAPAFARIAEDRIEHVHTRVEGWVEAIAVHSLGERVQPGQVLFELYSPKLSAAQEDYLIALREGGRGSRAERAAAFRLLTLGADEGFIAAIAEAGRSRRTMPVRAASAGVVTALGIRHGMFLEPATVALELSDLSELWVDVRLSSEALEALGEGRPRLLLRHPGREGRVWRAADPVLLPLLDPLTRMHTLRYRVPNRRGLLAPGDFLLAELVGEGLEPVLAVPRSAVIRLPEGARVVRAEGEGRFRPVPVVLGRHSGRYVEIRRGLGEGEQIVTNAQFLLDAEAALGSGLDRYRPEEGHAH